MVSMTAVMWCEMISICNVRLGTTHPIRFPFKTIVMTTDLHGPQHLTAVEHEVEEVQVVQGRLPGHVLCFQYKVLRRPKSKNCGDLLCPVWGLQNHVNGNCNLLAFIFCYSFIRFYKAVPCDSSMMRVLLMFSVISIDNVFKAKSRT